MAEAVVSRETCEAKHSELLRALQHVEKKLDEALDILIGNGKPGLRQTQQELATQVAQCGQRHAEIRQAAAELAQRRDSWIMFLLKPVWPYVPPALAVGLWYLSKGSW